jgi:hypothetical protein
VVDARGNAYLDNIGFDFPGCEPAPGSVVVVTPAGTVRLVADDLAFPNGMAITADGSTLIVAESPVASSCLISAGMSIPDAAAPPRLPVKDRPVPRLTLPPCSRRRVTR